MEKINPYESIPERLHNCPNCGGTLQDDGKIVHFKAVFDSIDVNMHRGCPVLYVNNEPTVTGESIVSFEGSVDFTVVGGIIVEDPKITGVGG